MTWSQTGLPDLGAVLNDPETVYVALLVDVEVHQFSVAAHLTWLSMFLLPSLIRSVNAVVSTKKYAK